jgi:(p)ppGpp synthase/HD superfamily hydrolase
MRPIKGTVTDPRALQRVEQLLDERQKLTPDQANTLRGVGELEDGVPYAPVKRLTARAEGETLGPEGLRLALAQSLARVAHHGQLRKDGETFTNHLDRVASRLPTVRLRTVAWLHDVLEDTKVDGETLFVLFPRDVVLDVIALTRGFPGEESYSEFIDRTIVTGSDGALQVKLADLADNLSTLDAAGLSSLRARYLRADVQIRNELKRRITEYARRNAA